MTERIGDKVYYYTADNHYSSKLQPLLAFITGIRDDGTVNLAVFTESGIAINHIFIEHSPTPKYGCWSHIPEQE